MWANFGQKIQSCLFIPTLAFWVSDPKSIFGEIWAEKVKVVQFGWKFTHRVSRQCWFLFQHYFSQFSTLNPFLDKFGAKNSKLFILTKNSHTWYTENADFYSDNSCFELSTLNTFLGKFWLKKSNMFVLPENWHTCTYTQVSWRCWFLFRY